MYKQCSHSVCVCVHVCVYAFVCECECENLCVYVCVCVCVVTCWGLHYASQMNALAPSGPSSSMQDMDSWYLLPHFFHQVPIDVTAGWAASLDQQIPIKQLVD